MPLDELMPEYDVNEVHSTEVAAAPAEVLDAVRALTSREVPLVIFLMSLRGLPAALAHPRDRWARIDRVLDAPLLDHFTGGGFVVLAEHPDELVLGVIGRFWAPDGGIRRLNQDEFIPFDEPGFAKGIVNFQVREAAGGSLLTTETRVSTTDEAARKAFRRYWRIVMPGSALIRRAWLRAIRKRAERR